MLALTGAWLWFNYRPSVNQAWPVLKPVAAERSWVRTVHRLVSGVTVVLGLAVFVLLIGRRIRAGGRGIVAGAAVLGTAAAASITGYLLPWDQLALWAVTVGTDIRGVQSTFRAEVKYVLVGSREVSPGTYHFWAITHVVLGLVVAVAVLLAWLRTREPTPATEDAELVAAP